MIQNIWSMGDAGLAVRATANVNLQNGLNSPAPGNGPMLIDLDSTHKLLAMGSGATGFDSPVDTTVLWVIDFTNPGAPVVGPSLTMNTANGDTNGLVGDAYFDVLPSAHSFYYFYADIFSRLVLAQFTWSPSTLAISFGTTQLIGSGSIANVVVLSSTLLVTNLSGVWQKWPLTAGAIGATSGTLSLAPPSSGFVGLVINNSGGGQDIVQFTTSLIGGNPGFTMQAILPSGSNGSATAAWPAVSNLFYGAWSHSDMTDQFYLLRANPVGTNNADLYLATVNPSTGAITTSLVHGGGASGAYNSNALPEQYRPSPVLFGISPPQNIFNVAGWVMVEEATKSLSDQPMQKLSGGSFDPNYLYATPPLRTVSNPRSCDTYHFAVATADYVVTGGTDTTFGNVSIRYVDLALRPFEYDFVTDFQFQIKPKVTFPTRQFPREDTLALGGRRQAGTAGNLPTSQQSSIRQAPKVYS